MATSLTTADTNRGEASVCREPGSLRPLPVGLTSDSGRSEPEPVLVSRIVIRTFTSVCRKKNTKKLVSAEKKHTKN